MKRTFLLTIVLVAIISINAYSQNNLLQESDLVYLGAFRIPSGHGGDDCHKLSYGGQSMAYNPHNDSLFVVGHSHCLYVAEISIPEPVKSSDLSALNRASYLTPHPYFFDPTEGNRNNLGENKAPITGQKSARGLLVYGNKLIGTSKVYYDGGYNQRVTHYTRSLDLTQTSFAGHFEPAVSGIARSFTAGYLGLIPSEYQNSLGGKAVAGMSWGPIAPTASYGPAFITFNPDQLGVVEPFPVSQLLYYDSLDHGLDGTYYSNIQRASIYTSPDDHIGGVAFPSGARSVLFFGSHGTSATDGYSCYGPGVSTLEQAYTSGPPYLLENRKDCTGGHCCYDPTSSSKGLHAYPYVNQIWAYDVNDLIAVKNGSKKPWEPVPYAVWNPTFPTAGRQISSAAYDPVGRRIFVAQSFADGSAPVFHVFKVAGTPSDHSCFDGIKNGNETGVDCGGGCAPCLKPPMNVRSVQVTP